jgi:DNA-binding NtrC family response regulator
VETKLPPQESKLPAGTLRAPNPKITTLRTSSINEKRQCLGIAAAKLVSIVSASNMPLPKILLVDDDLSVREALGRALQREGYEVFLARSGQEALERLCDTEINLVLLDINMPGLNGWDTLDQMLEVNPFLPVIIITAWPDQRTRTSRALAMLEKPLALAPLLEFLKQVMAETVEARRRRVASGESFALPLGAAKQ